MRKKISPTLTLSSCRSHRPLSPPFPFPCSLSTLSATAAERRQGRHYYASVGSGGSRPTLSSHDYGPPQDHGVTSTFRGGEDAGEREQRERTTSALPYGRRSPSSPPPASGPPPPRRRPPVPLVPAASRPAAHLPDGQLLVCSPPRAGGWAPAPAGGSPVRWAACRLTPAPAGKRLDVTSPAQLASSVLIVLLVW